MPETLAIDVLYVFIMLFWFCALAGVAGLLEFVFNSLPERWRERIYRWFTHEL